MIDERPERRHIPMHMEPLSECVERYKNVMEKLDNVVQRLDKINGRYERHLEEAIPYRQVVSEHSDRFKEMNVHRRFTMGLQFSIIATIAGQIMMFVFLWGQLTSRFEGAVNRLQALEQLHPRYNLNGSLRYDVRGNINEPDGK